MLGRSSVRFGVLFALMLILAPAARAQERTEQSAQERAGKIDLRPKFEPGQRIRYKLEQAFSTVDDRDGKCTPQPATKAPKRDPEEELQERAPASRSGKGRIEMGLLMNVKEVSSEGVATVETTIDSLKISSVSGGMEMEFDSKKPAEDDDPIAMLLKPIVGTTLTLKVDRAGNITSVSGGEAFSMLGQAVSGGGGSAGQLFGPIFSSHPSSGFANVGQTWEHEDKLGVSLLGDFRMVTRHTLRGMQGRDALVLVSGRIEPGSESTPDSGIQVRNSSYSGSYTWDTANGQLAKMDTSMTVRLEGTVSGQPLATRSESTVKITRQPLRP